MIVIRKPSLRLAGALLASGALLSGCKGHSSSKVGGGAIKFEAACGFKGLPAPLRQTVILIDEASLTPASASNFREKNPGVIDAVVAVADAESAVASGALAPRERVTLFVTPRDGSTARMVFTGCAPALSDADKAKLETGASSLTKARESYFANGAADSVADLAKDYRVRLLGAVERAASDQSPDSAPRASSFEQSSFVRSLHATNRLVDPAQGIPRIIVVAPTALASISHGGAPDEAKAAGFAAAKRSQIDLGLAEVDVALAPAGSARDYAAAFLLGSKGSLSSWSSQAPTSLPPEPASVRNLSGEIDYGKARYPIQVRIAADRTGTLLNSWFVVKRETSEATPLTGSLACGSDDVCKLTTDAGGFAQAWSTKVGPTPEFSPDIPFSGLRSVEMTIDGTRASGRVFDPMVDRVGDLPALPFTLARL